MADTLIDDGVLKDVARELGLSDLSPEMEQAVTVALGEQIYTAVMIEILEILPKPKHAEFRAMIGKVSPLKMYGFLEPYLDLAAVAQRVAKRQTTIMKGRLAGV